MISPNVTQISKSEANQELSEPHVWCSAKRSAWVHYADHCFLTIDNYSNMNPHDIDYAESQGCFVMPEPRVLGVFVQQYFMKVHPFFPLLDEKWFWEIYTKDQATARPSLC